MPQTAFDDIRQPQQRGRVHRMAHKVCHRLFGVAGIQKRDHRPCRKIGIKRAWHRQKPFAEGAAQFATKAQQRHRVRHGNRLIEIRTAQPDTVACNDFHPVRAYAHDRKIRCTAANVHDKPRFCLLRGAASGQGRSFRFGQKADVLKSRSLIARAQIGLGTGVALAVGGMEMHRPARKNPVKPGACGLFCLRFHL